jgi:hypothetical protein
MKDFKQIFVNLFNQSLSEKEQKRYKRMIKSFFDGDFDGKDCIKDPRSDCRLSVLGVTDVQFRNTKELLTITFVLEKPGLLIGKRGNQVRKLVDYLSIDKKVEIKTVESKLWK